MSTKASKKIPASVWWARLLATALLEVLKNDDEKSKHYAWDLLDSYYRWRNTGSRRTNSRSLLLTERDPFRLGDRGRGKLNPPAAGNYRYGPKGFTSWEEETLV